MKFSEMFQHELRNDMPPIYFRPNSRTMDHNARLKICATCKNKMITKDHETVCKLTQQPPAFEDSCPSYSYKEVAGFETANGGGISWRTILSIILICVGLIRIAVRCNRNDRRQNSYQYESPYENQGRSAEVERALSDVGAEYGKSLPALSAAEARSEGLFPLKKDSLIKITKKLSYIMPGSSFTSSDVLSESVPVFYVEPQRYEVMMVRVTSGDNILDEWQSFRMIMAASGETKSNIERQMDVDSDDRFNYSITNVMGKVNGAGKIVKEGKYAYVLVCEHPLKTKDQVKSHFDIIEKSYLVKKY